jgi:thymidylate synthase (FAD)
MIKVPLSYEIIDCPDGEKALAKLERICRIAYKSEHKIDDGFDICQTCDGESWLRWWPCPVCKGKGRIKAREPSSHELLKGILKNNRREILEKKTTEILTNEKHPDEVYNKAPTIVDTILKVLEEDPPHESVIEHESITVHFIANRGFTHELVRHRLCAFTQESTRYCNYSKGKFNNQISVTDRETADKKPTTQQNHRDLALLHAEKHYMELIADGVKPQIARGVLPIDLKAEIICTANFRQWRHIFKMRGSPKVHPDMLDLMIPLRNELRERIPIIFDKV